MVSEILYAAEDNALGKKTKRKTNTCTHSDILWAHIEHSLYQWLDQISLDDVMNGNFDATIFEHGEKTPRIKAI
jgi:DNA-binding IscR family transcriptional regulator